jgi:hypothetical protein
MFPSSFWIFVVVYHIFGRDCEGYRLVWFCRQLFVSCILLPVSLSSFGYLMGRKEIRQNVRVKGRGKSRQEEEDGKTYHHIL